MGGTTALGGKELEEELGEEKEVAEEEVVCGEGGAGEGGGGGTHTQEKNQNQESQ